MRPSKVFLLFGLISCYVFLLIIGWLTFGPAPSPDISASVVSIRGTTFHPGEQLYVVVNPCQIHQFLSSSSVLSLRIQSRDSPEYSENLRLVALEKEEPCTKNRVVTSVPFYLQPGSYKVYAGIYFSVAPWRNEWAKLKLPDIEIIP